MVSEPKVNVLLVDDHPENLLALEAILETLGQNLVKANSGAEALRCLLNQDFAVILLDVQMPDMDGFETAALIRQRERSRYTPIIFLTAFSTSENMVFKGYSLGAVDYLFKPIEPEILKSKVAAFVDLFQKTEEVKRQAAQLQAMNAELRTSEERFRSLSACSPVGIFLTDIEGRCTYTNPCFRAIYGITMEDSLGEGWTQAVHPEDRERVFANWYACFYDRQEYRSEFRIVVLANYPCDQPEEPVIHSQGNGTILQGRAVRWVNVHSSPMRSDQGELIGYVGTVEDITERKQAEEERIQLIRETTARKEAEAANRLKDEFLATLSHELRTPLNSILGWAALLRNRKFDENTTARALETIERNASLQAQLIDDILDVSRIIRGKLRLQMRPVNLVSVIEAAVDTVRLQAEGKSLDVSFVIADAELGETTENLETIESNGHLEDRKCQNENSKFCVSGDPDRLQQVVWNLLTNAIKFTPTGGKIEVRLANAGADTEIIVSDTGMGISPDFLPYVFDRFRQGDGSITRTHGGLGLGLAIVRHLVELHQGNVDVESGGEGQGAKFTVKLPLLKKEEQASQPAEKQIISSSPLRLDISNPATPLTDLQVLVVDDDNDTRDFISAALKESGATVTAVSSASEALLAIEQSKPDVLVSDIGMPEEDGYTLIHKVRNLEPEQGGLIPAIALTAYVREQDCTRALDSGFQMYVSKPVEPAKLINVVVKLVETNGHI